MLEHLSNCHGEWNTLLMFISSVPFIGMWLKTKLTRKPPEDKDLW